MNLACWCGPPIAPAGKKATGRSRSPPLTRAEVTVESGQQVVLAGGGAGAGEDGADWTETIQSARRPASACTTEGAWFVTDLE